MGVVNVTPDSFSDGGLFFTTEQAVGHALRLVAEGADILDVGGESTRPGSIAVDAQQELARVLPVVEGIRNVNPLIPISIDTTKAIVAEAAIACGATMVNDVSAGTSDSQMLDVVASAGVPYVMMHMLGQPRTMQDDPRYDNVVIDIVKYLSERTSAARARGIQQIFVDPGIGFGKTVEHNLSILRSLEQFADIADGLLLGISRKRFLGSVTGITEPEERDVVTTVAHALLIDKPVDIIRVHNVALCAQLRSLTLAIR